MSISICAENLKIDNYSIRQKDINIRPVSVFSNNDIYLINLVWYIINCRFFEFYRINDYELLSLSKIVSGIIEHSRYSEIINNDAILECIEFANDIIENNKKNITDKIFAENKFISINRLYLKSNSFNEIYISSDFEAYNIINIIFTYNKKSFSAKAFFSRKIDVFIAVLENILKILINNNILNTLYIADYNYRDLENISIKDKNISSTDFIFKIKEISKKYDLPNIKNRLDLINIFLKYCNHNIIIENINADELGSIIENEAKKRNFLLICRN
ncbi:hypothetical protein [uncultured Brachyspira sp.]|uniref:hypothetical protein n=1 Tax=uncultured Brachyspira sp. TaxID=221953 RepID=UPI0026002EC9|nr:hypothetical protein [uncultured Brachyspira sp.]